MGAQVEPGDPGDVADASGASDCDEDTIKRSTKLLNGSERERKLSERRDEENSPKLARDELDDPGGETAVPAVSRVTQDALNARGTGRWRYKCAISR